MNAVWTGILVAGAIVVVGLLLPRVIGSRGERGYSKANDSAAGLWWLGAGGIGGGGWSGGGDGGTGGGDSAGGF